MSIHIILLTLAILSHIFLSLALHLLFIYLFSSQNITISQLYFLLSYPLILQQFSACSFLTLPPGYLFLTISVCSYHLVNMSSSFYHCIWTVLNIPMSNFNGCKSGSGNFMALYQYWCFVENKLLHQKLSIQSYDVSSRFYIVNLKHTPFSKPSSVVALKRLSMGFCNNALN